MYVLGDFFYPTVVIARSILCGKRGQLRMLMAPQNEIEDPRM